MLYKCKILTDEFLAKVDAYISNFTKHIKDDEERKAAAENQRKNLYVMWNNPLSFVDKPTIVKYFEGLGIYSPQYTEMTFVSSGKGYHIEPRITWLHQITKISDIKEIFSCELVD